jgi:hypothetical protein
MPKYIVQTYGVATWQYEVKAKNKEEAEDLYWQEGKELNNGNPTDVHDERVEFVEEKKDT